MESQRASAADLSGFYGQDFYEEMRRNAELSRAGHARVGDIEGAAGAFAGGDGERFPAERRFTAGQIPDSDSLPRLR